MALKHRTTVGVLRQRHYDMRSPSSVRATGWPVIDRENSVVGHPQSRFAQMCTYEVSRYE